MQYRILGPLVVASQDRQLPLGPLKDRTVLGVLLLHANEVVPRQRLIDELWGESPPPTAVKAVNGYVWQLRKALGGNGSCPIATRQPGYLIEVEDGELDAQQFSVLTAEARARASATEFEEASAIYSEALSLWRGRALSGIELESVGRHELERLDEERIVALMDRTDCDLALGRHDDLVGELDVLVAQHPLRERLYAQQMLALYRSGRQADALRAYHRARTSLVDELALEPGPALQRLERGILNHDPSLQTPAGTAHRNGVETPAAPDARDEQRRPRKTRRVVIGLALGLALAAGLVAAGLAGRDAKQVALTTTGSAVLVVDPGTGDVDARIPLSRRPIASASGDQSLWLAGADGTVTRVAALGSPKEETVQIGGAIGGIAFGDRSVWVSSQEQGSIVRLDPATLKVVDRIAVGNGPTAVVFGAGAAWVANQTDGTVSRVDSVRDVVTKTIPVGATPHALAFGAGSLWVADEQLGSVTRIDARTTLPVALIDVGPAPGSIAFGHGSLWVGDMQGGGVSRIDPRTDRVVSTTAVGASVDTLGVLPRDVWVGTGASGTLTRLDPRDGRIGKPLQIVGAAVGVVQLG